MARVRLTMTNFPPAKRYVLSGANAPAFAAAPSEPLHLSVHELGPNSDRPPVVFLHGFPDLAYAWRRQLPATAAAGFRSIAPDQRGFGGSSAPKEVSEYSMDHLCGDLADLLDALEIEKAVFVGHDWGSLVAWGMTAIQPDRVLGVASLGIAYSNFPPTKLLSSVFPNPDDLYVLWFQEPGVAEAVLDSRAELIFRKLYRGAVNYDAAVPAGLPGRMNPFMNIESVPDLGEALLSEEELDVYTSTFTTTGFGSAINWYRNIDVNFERHPEIGSAPLDIPVLMLLAEFDPVARPEMAAGMPAVCSNLEMHTLKAAHFIQHEIPDEVNTYLVDWLTRHFT